MPKAKRMALILKSAFKNSPSVNNQNENDESAIENDDSPIVSANSSPVSKPLTPEADSNEELASRLLTTIEDETKAGDSLSDHGLEKGN